ncbi:MAG: hypothetical protein HN919_12770 [Verrucomicrobia bacterium]|jgi:hypothetical protein|nr:hypothetical protein [Verrucomicrobiota bacterium]
MNKHELISYLERIDKELQKTATLYVYGSAAFILLDEPDRSSLDIDVAGPYSDADEGEIGRAAAAAGLPVNPGEEYIGDHIEWVGPLRLCLQPPVAGTEVLLWQGSKLRLQTGPVADLVTSKLIRYDEIDRSDVQYLITQTRITFGEVEAAAKCLPAPFVRDRLVLENLENLRTDMLMWGATDD